MEPTNELRFAVSDLIRDAEVGPQHVPMSLLGDFQKDVSEFLRGSCRDVDPTEVMVSVEEGSLALVATGILSAMTLWSDIERLQLPDSLSSIDSKRAAVIERWQAAARQNPHRKYKVVDSSKQIRIFVDSSSDFRRIEDAWVHVEKYIPGQVVDWGGKTRANVHLETEGGSILVVSATQELLAKEEQNRLYRQALLHISAEENLLTGDLRNPRLLGFESHQPAFDEEEFARMVNRGTDAWANVPNSTEWLENLRGSNQ